MDFTSVILFSFTLILLQYKNFFKSVFWKAHSQVLASSEAQWRRLIFTGKYTGICTLCNTLMSGDPTSELWKAAHLTALCLDFPTPHTEKRTKLTPFHVTLRSPGKKCFKITGFAKDLSGRPLWHKAVLGYPCASDVSGNLCPLGVLTSMKANIFSL